MSDQDQPADQPGQTPWGAGPAGSTPPPPPPPPPSYPSYPSGQPAAPYAVQPGYPTQPGYPAAPGYGAPIPPYGYGGPAIPYAHWGLRVGAYILDALLLAPGYFVGGIGAQMTGSVDNGTQTVGILLLVLGYAGAVGFAIWNQILRQGRTGASLGKHWLGIRVVREATGEPLGGGLTFGRALLHILDALPCYLGYLWPLWDAKRQTFADKLVGSVVLRQEVPAQQPWPQQSWPQQPPY